MIKLVTFDLDDTLWSVHPVIKRANQLLWSWLETQAPPFTARFEMADLIEGSAMRRALLERYPEIAHSMTEVRLRLVEQGLVEVGYSADQAKELSAAAFDYFMEHRNAIEPYDHAIPMLDELRSMGLMIGALSNGNADIRQTRLADWFDFQFNADSVGSAKPHRLMFDKALEHAGVSAAQAVHVGDHPINDVEAAKAIGIKTIWVNPEGTDWPTPAIADYNLECLSQIPGVIRQMIG